MRETFWQFAITILTQIFLIGGLFLFFEEDIKFLFRKVRQKWRLDKAAAPEWGNNKLLDHIRMVVETATAGKCSLELYLSLTVILIGIVLLSTYWVVGFRAILLALLLAVLPYVILRLRLERIRYRGSHEAEVLVSAILNHYRVHHFNIYETLEMVVHSEEEDLRVTKKLLFRLLVELRNTKNREEMKHSVDRFAYGIKTNWCSMLSQCIFAAAGEGINVTASLEDIMEQLKAAKRMAEEKKRLNSESTRIIQSLVPIAYLGSIFLGVKYLGVSFMTLVQNQLFTKEGLLLFTIIIVLTAMNFLLVQMLKSGKFDY